MIAEPRVFDVDALPGNLNVSRDVLRIRGLRMEPRLAYAVLWNFTGQKPGRVLLDYFAFRDSLAASERAVRRWLSTLEAAGLIEILAHEPRFADVYVRDWRRRGDRRKSSRKIAAKSQLALPFVDVGGDEERAAAIPIWEHRQIARRSTFEPTPPTAG